MKTSRLTKLIGGATLGVALLASSTTWALPPRQHSVRGVIEHIDHKAHTLTLAPANGSKPLVFVWKDSTRFNQRWNRICHGALEPGPSVRVSYRREIGQLVPREVKLQSDPATRCTTGECCTTQLTDQGRLKTTPS